MFASREERLQMRQRGAGTRKVKDVDFGFSFGSPVAPSPQPTRPESQPAPSVPEPRPPSRGSTPEKQQPPLQRSPRGTPSGSQEQGAKIRIPGSSRNHLPERPSTFDIPSDDTPEQGRSTKRRKIDSFAHISEDVPPISDSVPVDNVDGQPAPPDTTDTVAVEPNNEATSVPVEQSPKINGHASPDITNPASLSKQDGLEQTEDVPLPDNENNVSAGDVEQVEPEDDAAPRKEKSNHRRKEPKSTAQENVDKRRSLESTTEQQGNMQIETQEPTEPVIPEEPRETAQEQTEEQIPEDPRPSSQQPEKRKRGRPPTTARAAPSEDKRTGEEEAHSPEQDSIQTNTARKTGRPRKQRRVSTASPDGEAPGKPDGEADEPEPEPEPEDIEEEHADEAPESPQQPSITKRKKRIDNEEEPEGENQDSSQQLRRTKQRKRKDDEEGEEDAQDSPQPSRTKQKKRKDSAEEPEDGNQSSLQEPRRTKQKRKDTDEDQREDEDQDLPERQSSTAKQKGKKPVGRVPIRNNRRSLPAVQVPESLFPSSKKPKEQQRPEAAAAPSEKEDEQAPPAKPRRGRPSGSKNSSRKSTQLTKERVSSPQAEEQEQEEAETEVAADKDQEPKPKPKSQRGEAVPVTVHRLANAAALDISFSDSADSEAGEEADSADELATRTKTKFPNRAGVNPADVLAQICRETLDKTLATLKSGIANESNPARRAEWTRKRKAVEAYATELEGRLFEMSEILDSNFLLSVRLRRAKREMAELRARLLQVRRQREEVALRMDEVRRRHAEEEAASMSRSSINNSLHSLELALDRSRSRTNDDEDKDKPSASIAGLEFALRSVAQDVSSTAPGSQGGLLHLIKSFNAQLERTARKLEEGRLN